MVSLAFKTLAVLAAATAVQANYELLTTELTLLVPKGSFKTKTVTKYKTETVTETVTACGPISTYITDTSSPPIATDTYSIPIETYPTATDATDTFPIATGTATDTFPVATDTATDTFSIPTETGTGITDSFPTATDTFATATDTFPTATDSIGISDPVATATDTFSISDPAATATATDPAVTDTATLAGFSTDVGTDTVTVTITSDPTLATETGSAIFGRRWNRWY